jgi:hypothetical protein
MRLPGRSRRPKAGPTPSRLVDLIRSPDPALSLLARHLESAQTRLATLEGQHRGMSGRIDTLEGKPNGAEGDPIERHIQWAEEAHG